MQPVDKTKVTCCIDDIVILEYISGPLPQCRIWLHENNIFSSQQTMVWQDKKSIMSTKTFNVDPWFKHIFIRKYLQIQG